jgi:hypothetical protein
MNRAGSDIKWYRFLLLTTKWIMLFMILITALNIVLNCIALLLDLRWGYSWPSLLVGATFIVLAAIIRRLASFGLDRLSDA